MKPLQCFVHQCALAYISISCYTFHVIVHNVLLGTAIFSFAYVSLTSLREETCPSVVSNNFKILTNLPSSIQHQPMISLSDFLLKYSEIPLRPGHSIISNHCFLRNIPRFSKTTDLSRGSKKRNFYPLFLSGSNNCNWQLTGYYSSHLTPVCFSLKCPNPKSKRHNTFLPSVFKEQNIPRNTSWLKSLKLPVKKCLKRSSFVRIKYQ